MKRTKKIITFLGNLVYSRVGWAVLLITQVYYAPDREYSTLDYIIFFTLSILLCFSFYRLLGTLYRSIKKSKTKILLFIIISVAFYFTLDFSSNSKNSISQFVMSISLYLLLASISILVNQFLKLTIKVFRELPETKFIILLKKIIKTIFSWKVFLTIYIIFWAYYFKKPFKLEETSSDYIIVAIYYLSIALFVISFNFLRKISRFYSVSLSILFILVSPAVLYFTSPAMNTEMSVAKLYGYFYGLSLPIACASALIILISIPAYFRLLRRKPQYFMLTVFFFIFLGYASVIEYRFFTEFNGYSKFFCSYQDTKKINSSKVIRVIGSYSEGSGFFIDKNTVVTNRHVVEGEDYPKIVFPSGFFLTPDKVEMSTVFDIAFLHVTRDEPDFVVSQKQALLVSGEEALSFGYPLGGDIKGDPSIIPLRYENEREMPQDDTKYLQFSSTLVSGMSGGPVFDKCGDFIGINTMSTSGTSLIISKETLDWSKSAPLEEPKKIKLEPGATPIDSVYSYYYLLKARETQKCYDLLSTGYKKKSSYEEWTARFPSIISVEVFSVKEIKTDLVYVLFAMDEWVDGEHRFKTYEGTWETIREGEFYFLSKSHISELSSIYDSKGPGSFLPLEPKK